MVGRVRRARREIDEEGFVRDQRLLLRNPGHRLVGHVLNEMIALFGCFLGLDRIGALVERRIPLVRLAADETVEIFETAAARRPGVERSHRARLPYRDFVAFAELRRRVAVELRVRASGEIVLGSTELYPGAPVATSVMPPMPAE